jgi:hypothetical protein
MQWLIKDSVVVFKFCYLILGLQRGYAVCNPRIRHSTSNYFIPPVIFVDYFARFSI